jgi:hypothetical protein
MILGRNDASCRIRELSYPRSLWVLPALSAPYRAVRCISPGSSPPTISLSISWRKRLSPSMLQVIYIFELAKRSASASSLSVHVHAHAACWFRLLIWFPFTSIASCLRSGSTSAMHCISLTSESLFLASLSPSLLPSATATFIFARMHDESCSATSSSMPVEPC